MLFGLLLQSEMCSFHGMEGGVTDNVGGIFYPKNKIVPSIDLGKLGCYEHSLVEIPMNFTSEWNVIFSSESYIELFPPTAHPWSLASL